MNEWKIIGKKINMDGETILKIEHLEDGDIEYIREDDFLNL